MQTRLKRCLSLWEIVIYGVGLILGAGIYVLIGAAAGIAGNMLWLSFLVAAVVASFTALSYAELSALYPRAGAEFIFAIEAFGSPALAWIVGFWATLIGLITATAVALGFASYFALFVPGHPLLLAAGLLVVMSALNYWGIKESSRFNAVATSIEIGGLVLIIAAGVVAMLEGSVAPANFFMFPTDDTGVLKYLPVVSAAALIFFAYLGFEDIANVAEEAENPERILPRAYIYALLISTLVYVLVALVAVSAVPYQQLAASPRPLSLIMETLIGGKTSVLIAIIALFATANTVLITLIVGTRMLYGMAVEGQLPAVLGAVHERRRTPHVTILLFCVLAIAFLVFSEIKALAAITDIGIFLLFLVVNLANIVLRYRQADVPRPWRCPLNIGVFPVISALGVVSCLAMIITLDHPIMLFGREFSSLLAGLGIFALAVPLYFIFGRNRD
jgi:APA family basic amino acid/polyamine antiporter